MPFLVIKLAHLVVYKVMLRQAIKLQLEETIYAHVEFIITLNIIVVTIGKIIGFVTFTCIDEIALY